MCNITILPLSNPPYAQPRSNAEQRYTPLFLSHSYA